MHAMQSIQPAGQVTAASVVPAPGTPSIHSTRKVLRNIAIGILAVAAMGASAAAGAWVQAQMTPAPALSPDQERVIADQISRDSAYVRENVGQLAAKVGDMQAQLIAVGALSKHVAKAAGVAYTDPEIQASLARPAAAHAAMDDISAVTGTAEWSAEGLGRRLDMLSEQLSDQKDWLGMLDVVMTKRAGAQTWLPTFKPVEYPALSSSYGWRRHPVTGRHTMHEGLDFAAPKGTPIHAASAGVVTEARYAPGYGKMVELNHGNGLVTRYAHASSINVKLGELVERGQMIARVGSTGRSTGAHLHFEVRMAGEPVDPAMFLPAEPEADTLVADATKAAVQAAAQGASAVVAAMKKGAANLR